MLSRRELFGALTVLAWPLVAERSAWGQTGAIQAGQQTVTLKDQLEKGLRARRPQEFAFVRQVVQLVEQNQLPLALVQTTFLWARKKRPYPFVYFQVALTRRAAEQGIRLTSDLNRTP